MNLRDLISKNWPLILIIIASLAVHLFRIESLLTFGGDQGKDLEKIYEIAHGNPTLLGPEIGKFKDSVFYLGPVYYYFQLPFVVLTRFDPIGSVILIIISRILTVIFVYFSAKKLFGLSTAILSGIIAGFSHYWIDLLGFPSSPYLTVTTVSLIIFILLSFKKEDSFKKSLLLFFSAGFLSGINTNFHYLGLSTLPALLVFAFFQKSRKLKIISLLGGFLLAITPLILFEIKNKLFLTSQLFKLFSSGYISSDSTRLLENFIKSQEFALLYSVGINFPPPILLILLTTLLFLLFKIADNSIKLFLASLLVTNLLAASLYFGKTQPHYIASIYPLYFIFIAACITFSKRILKFLPVIFIIIISTLLIVNNNIFSASGHTMPEDLTLKEIRDVSRIISADVQKGNFNITSTLDGDSRAMPYRYLTRVYGKNAQAVENYDKIENLYVITRDPASSVRVNSLFEIASFQPSFISTVWEIKGNIRLIKLTKKETKLEPLRNFVIIVNPIRPRFLWSDGNINIIKDQLESIRRFEFPQSWLMSYDNLFDDEIINLFKPAASDLEIGAFLEVSEKLATDAQVSYKIANGDYYRPDKVFLSGYRPQDRTKIVKTYLKRFRQVYGENPQIAGAWYIDPHSLNLLSEAGIKSTVVVSDQYDTDAARVWGQYFSFPYYPSKYNSLEPARNQTNKIPIVQTQWAQRDPLLSYGKKVEDSRQSFQANDYINGGKSTQFFVSLLETYLNNRETPFNQITIGLEAGQEARSFKSEFEKQLEIIASFRDRGQLEVVKLSDFSNWYQEKYKGISPSHFLQKDESFWYMSPYMRIAVFKEGEKFLIKDLRYYHNIPSRDFLYKDNLNFLERKIAPVVDQIELQNQLDLGSLGKIQIKENFDRLTINADNKVVKITSDGVYIDNNKILKTEGIPKSGYRFFLLRMFNKIREILLAPIENLKYSQISGKKIYGVTILNNHILAVSGTKFGYYSFDFQTLSKFKSPSDILNKWQPWID